MFDNATKTATAFVVGMRMQQKERLQTKDEACWLCPADLRTPIERLHLSESYNIYFESALSADVAAMHFLVASPTNPSHVAWMMIYYNHLDQ